MTIEGDRRAGPRLRGYTEGLATAVVLKRGKPVGRFVVQDLSASGALLTGSRPLDPGTRVRVVLRFPDCDHVTLDARVQRAGRATAGVASIAVAFRHRSDATEDLIQREALAALLRSTHPAVLFVSDSDTARREVAARLEGLGRAVLTAATPLDALRWLEDPDARVDTVIVSQSLRVPGALTLLAFLAEEYPEIRRILLSEAAAPPRDLGETRPSGIYAIASADQYETSGQLAELFA